jgi:hypothetical protein
VLDDDNDGLTNAEEDANLNGIVDAGETDPHNADTDGDGFLDGDEFAAGSDPLDGGSYPTPPGCDGGDCIPTDLDADNDGIPDEQDPCPLEARNLCFGDVATAADTGYPLRINANVSSAECSGTKIDCAGNMWFGDFGYSLPEKAAECSLNGGGEDCRIAGIPALFGCEDESTEDLFQCEHADRNPLPELSYDFAVANGRYLVNLFFANTYTDTMLPGQRLFHIDIEGRRVYEKFDQVAAAGGSGKAVVRSAVVEVRDGNLGIVFRNLPKNNPAVKALEVLRARDDVSSPTTTLPHPSAIRGVPVRPRRVQGRLGARRAGPLDG